jgi:DNA helicase II / ATP-dependent DNA helicase PcrA
MRSTYKAFFDWLGKPELFKSGPRSVLEYSDVFPLIYLKLRLEGASTVHQRVLHLVIDEMQDYTPVQYAVISRLFSCDKTILGDANQAVHVNTGATADAISRVFEHAETVKLCKSYRSSYEISRFAQGISKDADLVAIERHGDAPVVAEHHTEAGELRTIVDAVAAFRARGARTMGIICKSQPRAAKLHEELLASEPETQLLTERSTAFVPGVVVCSAHLAKGLEFDEVVVPHATDENYKTQLEKNLLYVASTRAMHRLMVTYTGKATPFLPDASLYEGR